jgi:hypothetical protein
MGTLENPQGATASRLLSLSGAAAVASLAVAVVVLGGNSPGSNDSPATIRTFYTSHEVREMASSFITAAAAPLFVVFGVCLATHLWPSTATRRPVWQIVLVVGSAVAGVGFILPALLHIALTQTANNNGVSGGALQALAGLDESSWVAFNSGMGVMMLGAAGTLLARKRYPALGWVALAAGIALFIPLADFFALAISGLWFVTMSILLFRRGAAIANAI